MSGRMVRRAYGVLAAAVGLAAIGFTATAQPTHVELCHAIGSPNKPFVQIAPGVNGAYRGHYTHHEEDIIPPFEFMGETYSLNWTPDNRGTFFNGCQPLAPEEEEPPEVEPGPPIVNDPPFTG